MTKPQGIRPRDALAIQRYREQQECGVHEAGVWDDRRRYTEAINEAETVEDLKQVLRVLIREVIR